MNVYRKKQLWDSASLPEPVISPLRNYKRLVDPPTDRWPVFPTFDQRTLARLVHDELADRGLPPEAINDHREAHAHDLLLALKEDIRPPSLTTGGARLILQRLTTAAELAVDHPKHDYLAPHGGRRGMGEILARSRHTRPRGCRTVRSVVLRNTDHSGGRECGGTAGLGPRGH